MTRFHHIFPFLFFVLNAKMSHIWQGFFLQHNVLQKHACFLFQGGLGRFGLGGGFWKIAIEILRYTLCSKLLHLYFSCFGNLGHKICRFLCLLLLWVGLCQSSFALSRKSTLLEQSFQATERVPKTRETTQWVKNCFRSDLSFCCKMS